MWNTEETCNKKKSKLYRNSGEKHGEAAGNLSEEMLLELLLKGGDSQGRAGEKALASEDGMVL